MSKRISDEEIRLNIVINGNEAQKKVNDLEKETIKFKQELDELNKTQKKLERQRKTDSEEYKENAARVRELNSVIDKNENQLRKLTSELKLTDMTMTQLRSKAALLSRTLAHLAPDTDDFKKYDAELKQVQSRIDEVRGKALQSKNSIGSIADSFNRYQGMAVATITAFTGVAYSISKIIELNAKLSDAQADVIKTTGMTKQEVDDLTKSFGELNTRTSRVDLLKIAEQGGKLGVPKAEIQDFVKSMNVAAVALGDSFTGGVDEVAEKLGKIKFLFKETKDMNIEQAYNSIGSAINDLGANGTANEANIAEFTKRIGSLTDVLKPTVQETLALGTAFEESGIEAETSSRAYNIFMKQASTESAKFAKVMGVSKKAVEDMINTNPLNFMLEFAKGMNGMNATEVAKTLDLLGVNADGANKVIGAMGNNFSRFHELIDLSNNSFATGTSLIQEYNVKNENLAATLEKISKKVSGWFSSETFIKYLGGLVSWFGKLIGATEDAEKSGEKWRTGLFALVKIFAVATVGLFSYRSALFLTTLLTNGLEKAVALSNVAQKAWNFTVSVGKMVTGLFNGSLMLLRAGWIYVTQGSEAATVALRIFNTTTKLNPIGAFITLLVTAATAFIAFRGSAVKAEESISAFAKQQKDLAKSVSDTTKETKAHLTSLITVLQDTNVSFETRKKVYEELVRIAPIFNGFLKDEKINIDDLLVVYDQYIKSLDKVAYAKAFSELNDSNIAKEVSDSQKLFEAEKKLANAKKALSNYVSKFKKEDRDFDYMYGLEDLSKKQLLAQKEYDIANSSRNAIKKLISETNEFKANEIKNLQLSIDSGENEIKRLVDKTSKEYKKAIIKLNADKQALNSLLGITDTKTPETSNYNIPAGKDDTKKDKKNPNSSDEEINRIYLENQQKFSNEYLKNQQQLEDDKIALMEDGYAKELAIENQRYAKKMAELEKQKVHSDELAKMDEEIAKAHHAGDVKKYEALLFIKEQWVKRNTDLDKQVSQLEQQERGIHNRKLHELELKAFDKSVKDLTDKFEHEKLLRDTAYNNELAAAGNNAAKREIITKEHNRKEIEAQLKHLQDLANLMRFELFSPAALSLTPAEKKAFQEKLDYYENAIAKLKSAQKGDGTGKEIDLGIKGGNDILGFSQKQWDGFFTNIEKGTIGFQTMAMAMGAAANVLGEMDKLFTAQENSEVKRSEGAANAKKNHLKKQLDAGFINQKQYNRRIEKIDKELDDKKFETELAQAKRQKVMSLAQIAISTAQAIMGIWRDFPKADFGITAAIMTGVVGALGIAQAATVMATPLPTKGYEEGLYPDYVKREQDGKMFKANYGGKTKSGMVTKPTYFLTGENGPEMIIDSQAYTQLSPQVRTALEREIRGIKGFENGYYNLSQQPTQSYNQTTTAPSTSNDELMKMMMAVMQKNTEVMERIEKNGILAMVDSGDYRAMKNLKTGIKNYEELVNKSKK